MRFFTLCGMAVLAAASSAAAQQMAVPTFTNPSDYNNYIVNEQRQLLRKNLRYISKAAHSDNEKKIENRRLDVVQQNELALARLAKLKAYEGDKDFKGKATEALYQQLKVYSDDYKQVDFLAATRTKSVENMEAYFRAQERAEAKLQAVGDSVNAAQLRFARHHGMSITRDKEVDELDRYIAQVSEVNAYQHRVVVPQFRLEKAIARVTDALNAQDAAAFETARTQLLADAKLAQDELAAIQPFRNKDTQYRDAATNLAKLYTELANSQFVKTQALMTQKNSLTKAQVTEINGYINYFNQNSNRLIQAYNQASSNFAATYVPVFTD